MQQHPLAPTPYPPSAAWHARAVPPGYETTSRGGAPAADAGMAARHEYRARPRQLSNIAAGPLELARAALELRRRRLRLLALG